MNFNPDNYILSPTQARRILNRAYTRWATKDLHPTLAMLWPPLALHYDPHAPAIPEHLELPLLEIAESDGSHFYPDVLKRISTPKTKEKKP